MTQTTTRPVCAIVGVGPGNGAALARRFDREGYALALMARGTATTSQLADEFSEARAYTCDVTDEASITAAFEATAADLGPVDVLLYNVGSGFWGSVEAITTDDMRRGLEINLVGLLACAQAVIPSMTERGEGSIIITGATASLRGGANFAGFAPAKGGQRILAQSMARHLGPKGIHVALIIVDGQVDLPRTRARQPERPDEDFIKPDAIADTALFLVNQDPSAWTFELDVRPHVESW